MGDDELIVTRNELDDAQDRLFLIGTALSDAEADLADGVSAGTVLRHLMEQVDSVAGQNPS